MLRHSTLDHHDSDFHRFGLVGWPVAQSLSPAIHRKAFQLTGLRGDYELLPTPIGARPDHLDQLKASGLIGLNITVPHKTTWLGRLELSPLARAIGAINTVDLRSGKAHNTDLQGFLEDLAAHRVSVQGARTLVIGSGGAARAVIYGLHEVGAEITVTGRDLSRVSEVVSSMEVDAAVLPLRQRIREPIDLVVHATPVGSGSDLTRSIWPSSVPFPTDAVFYDMVYHPQETALMRAATASGCRAIGGLGMLVRQAVAAFSWWTGHQPPVEPLLVAARTASAKLIAHGRIDLAEQSQALEPLSQPSRRA